MSLDSFVSKALSLFPILPVTFPVECSGLESTVSVSKDDLYNVLLPLLYSTKQHLNTTSTTSKKRKRVVIGIAGPAGSGKSTLASLLVSIGNYIHNNDKVLLSTCCSLLSGDGYHLPNSELVEKNLKSKKGVIETFHGNTFANDLELLKSVIENVSQEEAIGSTTLQERIQPPLPPDGPSLGSRSSWANIDKDGTIWLPNYDRAITHDPKLHQVQIKLDSEIIFVEGLYMARGDGTTTISGKTCNPLGPDSNAWKRVYNTLDEVILLNVPLSLCRARCLQRRVKSTPINLLDTVIEATDQHYCRNDAVTYRDIIECDVIRATIIVDVPSFSEINDTMNPKDAIEVLSHIKTSSFFAGASLRFMNDK